MDGLTIGIFAVIVVILLLGMLQGGANGGPYKSCQLMTDNEREFFERLVLALPDHYIFPQVAMSALIQSASTDIKKAHTDRLRIAQQRVDFVICNRAGKVVAVVELDDRTHSVTKDKIRDTRLQQAGLRVLRFQSKNKPAVDALREAVFPQQPSPQNSSNFAQD